MILIVDSNGKIIRVLDDSDGTVISLVTFVMEFEDHLYLGSPQTNFIAKPALK